MRLGKVLAVSVFGKAALRYLCSGFVMPMLRGGILLRLRCAGRKQFQQAPPVARQVSAGHDGGGLRRQTFEKRRSLVKPIRRAPCTPRNFTYQITSSNCEYLRRSGKMAKGRVWFRWKEFATHSSSGESCL